jgi:hypothetical protein
MGTEAIRPAGLLSAGGSWMGWVLRLVETGTDSRTRSVDVMEISRPNDLGVIANLGLTLPEEIELFRLRRRGLIVFTQQRSREKSGFRSESTRTFYGAVPMVADFQGASGDGK